MEHVGPKWSGRYLAKLLLAEGKEVVNLSSRSTPIALASRASRVAL